MIVLTIISALFYSSFIEYCIHRFVHHSSNKMDHIKNHHRIFHGLKSYEVEDAKPGDILLDAKGILLNGVLYLIPVIILFNPNMSLGVLFFVICFLYNLWEEYVHLYSHKSTNTFLKNFTLFKKLKEHHRVHHYIYNSNYGIGCTFWDIIFRTKRGADKERESRMKKHD